MTTRAHLHIIEPTLTGEAGHCLNFVSSLCTVSPEQPFRLWVSRDASLKNHPKTVMVERYFSRRLRRLQECLLLRNLLRGPGRIFISTAGRTDLVLLDWAARGTIPQDKVFLYFHWLRLAHRKREHLRKIARKQPHLRLLGPTPAVVDLLRDCGFSTAELIPYPITPASVGQEPLHPFARLLYAGAARRDKGFGHVVDLVEFLATEDLAIPVRLQCSGDHYARYDSQTRADLHRLQNVTYRYLQLDDETLSDSEYVNQFAGSICLQPYDRDDFADRISGVTLDALSAGCPIVTVAGTWMARVVERFSAGVAVAEITPAELYKAVQTITADYAGYRANAWEAGRTLQQEYGAAKLFRVVTGLGEGSA